MNKFTTELVRINQIIAEATDLEPGVLEIVESRDNPGAQSYMIDIIPYLHKLFPIPVNPISVLDVGAKTGGGTALLASIHSKNACSSLIFDCTALDIVPWFQKYAEFKWGHLMKYQVGDIFKIEDKYDLVVCSHTIEHVPDPSIFIQRLKEMSKGYVVTYCPYKEINMVDGHLTSFDEATVSQLNPLEWHVHTNIGWKTRGDCLLMIFKGCAT